MVYEVVVRGGMIDFAHCIKEIGFFPCKYEPDIWMRKNGNLYEYIAVYVDDQAIAMKDPKELTDILEKQHEFKLKGTVPITLHLGMDFTSDDDNTLCISLTKYINNLVKNYVKSFGMIPNTGVTSPLENEIIQSLIRLNYALQNKLLNLSLQ
jgi:Reverse transcriptase (RNA-dependent DNA polymerase)